MLSWATTAAGGAAQALTLSAQATFGQAMAARDEYGGRRGLTLDGGVVVGKLHLEPSGDILAGAQGQDRGHIERGHAAGLGLLNLGGGLLEHWRK